MSIARGLTKAVKAAKKQSRGLKGNRNSQGDFMPEDVQMKGVQDAVAPDIQNYVNDVKNQIDEIDSQIAEIQQDPTNYMPDDALDAESLPVGLDLEKQLDSLEVRKEELLDSLIEKLEEEGIDVPEEVWQMTAKYSPDENRVMYQTHLNPDESRPAVLY